MAMATAGAKIVDRSNAGCLSSSSPQSQEELVRRLDALLPCARMPTDHDRAPHGTPQPFALGTAVSSSVTAADWDRLYAGRSPREREATLLALFGGLVRRYTREAEVVLGLVTVEGTSVGVPMHEALTTHQTLDAVAVAVDRLLAGAAPLAELMGAAAAAAGGNDGALGQRLATQAFAMPALPRHWPTLCFSSDSACDEQERDLCLLVVHEGGGGDGTATTTNPPTFALRYNARLFSPRMAEAMLRSWETLVGAAGRDPAAPLDHLPCISSSDAQWLVQGCNQTAAAFAPRAGIHQLFEARVDEAPHRLAIVGPVDDGGTDSGAAAAAYPERVAELTYGEMEAAANRMAHHLLKRAGRQAAAATAAGGSRIVAILLERSVGLYVAMLGVLKAGAAYLSIDPDYPDERIQFMLQDSGAVALVTTTALAARIKLPTPPPRVLCLDDPAQAAALAAEPPTRPDSKEVALDPESLCYVIYTSGSTGKPKGVQISHANALNLVRAEEVIYCVEPADRVLQGFSTSFDASVEEVWMAFNSGAALVVGTKEVMRSGPDFPAYLEALGVTCLSTVPTLLAMIPDSEARRLANVRLIITGGEACSKELVERWAEGPETAGAEGAAAEAAVNSGRARPQPRARRRFFNTYGPTETTVIATYKECFRGAQERMTIGKPLLNYQCYVLDEQLNLLPPGAVGELVIGGASVSRRGYLNLPEKTASAFRPDHLTGGPHPLYRSGDLARLSCLTGEIEYLGRADSQVKIRGYRVELSEIEAVLARLPGVKSAVVAVQRGTLGAMQQHIVAFVVPDVTPLPPPSPSAAVPSTAADGKVAARAALPTLPDTAGLLQAMRETLPAFMIPSQIEMVAAFPTLPSGKVDRRRLPQVMKPASRRAFARSLTGSIGCSAARLHNALAQAPSAAGGGPAHGSDDDDSDDDEDGAAAWLPPFQRLVATAFEAVLGLPEGSIAAPEADFFDLGGNSLLVSLLVTRLRHQQPRLTARDVYEDATVGGVARVLEELAEAAAEAVPTVPHAAAPTTTAIAKANAKGIFETEPRAAASTAAQHNGPHVPSRTTLVKADALQLLGMYVVATFLGLNGLGVYTLAFHYKARPAPQLFLFLAALSTALLPASFVLVVVAKWLVLGRVRAGRHPLWGAYHLRFWLVQCLDNCFRIFFFPLLTGTPLLPLYYRALGCRVGRDVFMDGTLDGYDLVEVGDGCVLNCQATASAVTIEANCLWLRRVRVGRRCVLGVRAAVEGGAAVGDGSQLEAMALVPAGAAIPAGQLWSGAPCMFKASLPTSLLPQSPRHRNTGWAVGGLQILWALLLRVLEIGLLLPFLCLARRMHEFSLAPIPDEGSKSSIGGDAGGGGNGGVGMSMTAAYFHLVWVFAAMHVGYFALSSLVVAGLRRVLLAGLRGRRQEYHLSSLRYLRQWAADTALDSLAVYTKQLRGTAYLPLFYRLMGARLGRCTEISSFEHVAAERLAMGDQAFLADDIIVGKPHVDAGGHVTHDHVRIGHRAFVGNASVVQTGTYIPDAALIGVASLAPKFSRTGETYVGCPPLKIKRECTAAPTPAPAPAPGAAGLLPRTTTTTTTTTSSDTTYEPTPCLRLLRFAVEGLGVVALHLSLGLAFAALYLGLELPAAGAGGAAGGLREVAYVLTLPCLVMAHAAICALLTIAWKWLVIGRFRAGSYPLYGGYVWRTEFVERVEENLLQTHAFPLITGTVWMQRVYQALGVRLGRRPYLEYPSFCEHDLCSAGDYLAMERTATLQAHLFQDRVRTTGPIRIGDFCSLGAGAVVLLNGAMGDHASLGTLSLVMRSEELPAGTKWHGLPAEAVVTATGGGMC